MKKKSKRGRKPPLLRKGVAAMECIDRFIEIMERRLDIWTI